MFIHHILCLRMRLCKYHNMTFTIKKTWKLECSQTSSDQPWFTAQGQDLWCRVKYLPSLFAEAIIHLTSHSNWNTLTIGGSSIERCLLFNHANCLRKRHVIDLNCVTGEGHCDGHAACIKFTFSLSEVLPKFQTLTLHVYRVVIYQKNRQLVLYKPTALDCFYIQLCVHNVVWLSWTLRRVLSV